MIIVKAVTLVDEELALTDKYKIFLKVYKVGVSKKFPKGIKAKFVLIDTEQEKPRLLMDNHEPFGFHMHTGLPFDKEVRVTLDVEDYNKALTIFFSEVNRIIKQ